MKGKVQQQTKIFLSIWQGRFCYGYMIHLIFLPSFQRDQMYWYNEKGSSSLFKPSSKSQEIFKTNPGEARKTYVLDYAWLRTIDTINQGQILIIQVPNQYQLLHIFINPYEDSKGCYFQKKKLILSIINCKKQSKRSSNGTLTDYNCKTLTIQAWQLVRKVKRRPSFRFERRWRR